MVPTCSLLLALVLSGFALSANPNKPQPWGFFERNVIYQPPEGYGVFYPRYVELQSGTFLVTTTLNGSNPAVFPVFQSKDGGAHWKWISNITDQVNGFGLKAQPALMQLDEALGGYPNGTVLAAGKSQGTNSDGTENSHIDLYASKNEGKSWEFVSHIVQNNNTTPDWTGEGTGSIYEPYLMVYDHELVCYYSDAADPEYAQRLSHKVSSNMVNWGSVVPDVEQYNHTLVPGMTIVTYIPPIQKWMLVHESPGDLSLDHAAYPIYYVLADSPLDFITGHNFPIVPKNIDITQQPSSSPYVTWTPEGGDYGTIWVSDADHSSIYYNQKGGDVNAWMNVPSPQPASYTRAIHVFNNYPDHMLLLGAGNWPGIDPPDVRRPLSLSVVNVTELAAGLYVPGGPDKDE